MQSTDSLRELNAKLLAEIAELRKGYTDGKFRLGNCFDKGIGIVADKKKAFELYKEIAEKGNINGKLQLGNFYNESIGTEINKEKAFELYKEVAENGNKFAQNILGYFYEKGVGTHNKLLNIIRNQLIKDT
jgi:TPR repeat protein